MEEKVNVAEILKDKPEGTKLWTDMFGEVTLYVVTNTCDAFQVKHHNKEPWFDKDGKLCKEGVLCIYPSKSMRDWEKFAWKKGDVLAGAFGASCIFDKWANDDYTRFDAKFVTPKSRGTTFEVEDWCKITNEACIRQYIRDIEEDNGGKLNLTTLEIENNQPEFKDGNIVCISGMGYLAYGIVKSIDNSSKKLEYYALNDMSTLKTDDWLSFEDKQIQPITETQQIILFDALAKEGKAWDADKKQIVDLKPKYEFKPMDLCLMKYIGKYNNRGWELCQYAYTEHRVSSSGEQRDFYHTVGGEIYAECIPYKGNEHLLGTKKSK